MTGYMLISNQEQEENLPDYDMALAHQLGCLLAKPCPAGVDPFSFVLHEFAKKGSQMWQHSDVTKVLKYVSDEK